MPALQINVSGANLRLQKRGSLGEIDSGKILNFSLSLISLIDAEKIRFVGQIFISSLIFDLRGLNLNLSGLNFYFVGLIFNSIEQNFNLIRLSFNLLVNF